MPELPEVEVNARNLARWSVGRRIVDVVPPLGTRETGGVAGAEVVRRLRGRTVEDVTRRGKWMLVALSGGAGLGLHLGMTGKIGRVVDEDAALPRFARAVFGLDDGTRVVFIDSRRFGKVLAEPRFADLAARREIADVGPDALSELREPALAAALAATKRTIKEALLDQRVLAGVGNIYATEALWRARIHPATPARRVAADKARLHALALGIRAALRHGLKTFGETDLPEYIEEGAPNPFFVYDRAGEPCRRCKTKLKAMTLGGRTSAFCPNCQKK